MLLTAAHVAGLALRPGESLTCGFRAIGWCSNRRRRIRIKAAIRRTISASIAFATSTLGFTGWLFTQEGQQWAPEEPAAGTIVVPASGIEHPGDLGVRAHTTYRIFVPGGLQLTSSVPAGETPASLACVYRLVTALAPGCTIAASSVNPTGGFGAIALVDAYDDPTAGSDLAVFSSQFGLPACTTANGCFQKVYASGSRPPVDSGWALEASLDVQWAHAMAPNAKIYLVEAASNSYADLFTAESVAGSLVVAAGGGEISNSWQGSEFSGETSYDSYLTKPGIVYFASSGDMGGVVGYPSVSPNVVSAGGTRVNRNASGSFTSESGWSGSGGGLSVYESRPAFQSAIVAMVGNHRGTPDLSFDADPTTGVSVYDSTPYGGATGWWILGGTSVASPSLAGIVNAAGNAFSSTKLENTLIYTELVGKKTYKADFRDVKTGNNGYPCQAGWDFCTGVGSVRGLIGK
jgi:kumamolisin